MGINQGSYLAHKTRNRLHSALLVAGLALLTGALGWYVGGRGGVVLLGFLAAVALLFGPRVSPRLVLRLYRGRLLASRQAPDLVATASELARRAGLPRVPDLYYIPTRVVNAFAVGGPNNSAIGLTDGLLRNLDLREITGILAHETSHVANDDGWVMGLADFASRYVSFLSWIGQILLFLNFPALLLGMRPFPWSFVLLMVFAPTIGALLQFGLSRSREYDADVDGVRLTGDPRGLASALAKIERLQGGVMERLLMPGRRVPDPSLLRTHPSTEDRIARLLELETELETSAERVRPVRVVVRGPEPTGPYSGALQGFAAVEHRPRWRVGGSWY